MNTVDFIQLETFCAYHPAEHSFIYSLHQFGLIDLLEATEGTFIAKDTLPSLEKMIRLHQDLEINVAGIDVVLQLLDRVQTLQAQNYALKSRLLLYETE